MKILSLSLFFLGLVSSWGAHAGCQVEPDSNAELIHCKEKLTSYPLPVHFYIPQNLTDTETVNYFAHFHGHNLAGYSHFDKRYADYGQYLLNSKTKAILVIAESAGNCTTYDNFFADSKKAIQFFEDVENEIKTQTNKEATLMALSGHSGAYRVLNRLMGYANQNLEHLNNVKALGMFDATYGAVPEISKWVKNNYSNTDFLFYDVFVSGKVATAEEGSLALQKELKPLASDKIFFVPVASNTTESLLDQHFMTLKRGSLELFWKKMAP